MMTIMEDKGLVIKEGDNRNRYRGVLKLTEDGKRAAEFVRERARLAVELAGGALTDEQRAVFYEALENIARNLGDMCKDGLSES